MGRRHNTKTYVMQPIFSPHVNIQYLDILNAIYQTSPDLNVTVISAGALGQSKTATLWRDSMLKNPLNYLLRF